jgi:RNase H-fold protein (predicted Holliday junction resolvase)
MDNILSLDRWSKRIGVAWMDSTNNIPLPLWYILNTGDVYFELSALIMKYNITIVVCGSPSWNKNVVDRINNFIKNLKICVSDTVTFASIDEHYSSTQASNITGDLWKKHISQDTVSAMVILERWKQQTKSEV